MAGRLGLVGGAAVTSDLSRHVCGQRVCDVQAAVLCCAVAAEAPKNRKKIWKKKDQSQWECRQSPD
jgi:hypothetical protein